MPLGQGTIVEKKYGGLHFEHVCHKHFVLFSLEDLFVTKVSKTITKSSKLTRRKKKGWFTKETMATVLNWSAFLI